MFGAHGTRPAHQLSPGTAGQSHSISFQSLRSGHNICSCVGGSRRGRPRAGALPCVALVERKQKNRGLAK